MFQHISVLKEEAVKALNIKADGIYVDCTLGGGGHTAQIAVKLNEDGLVIGFDQDDVAIEHATKVLAPYGNKVKLVKSNFRHIQQVLTKLPVPKRDGIPQVNGILYDLGVSSPQLDDAERGFSYQHDAELDMRMDQTSELTAYDIVNTWSEHEISTILRDYGEEKFARRIARHIVQARSLQPIMSTWELAECVKQAIPAATRRTGPHPAKRSFQAIRIAVNDELGAFEQSLEQSITCLASGGRIAVITFHSLEDRICKHFFAKNVEKCECPPGLPVCVCQNKGNLKLVHRKPLVASEHELLHNPRARSAKLRIAEKL